MIVVPNNKDNFSVLVMLIVPTGFERPCGPGLLVMVCTGVAIGEVPGC